MSSGFRRIGSGLGRREFLAAAAGLSLTPWPRHVRAQSGERKLIETPYLADAVARDKLPPVHQRVPSEPAVARFGDDLAGPGRHGGTLHTLMARQKDIRMMVVYGYARLVGYTPELTLEPDLLRAVEVEENRRFTLHLRTGHRWSDGAPFTAEDFRFWWEYIANDRDLSPLGLPTDMLVQGERPRFEVLDAQTVRYTWDGPNSAFLPALAAPRPLFIYAPAHYLKQFHTAFADPERLQAMVEAAGTRNWAGLFTRKNRPYRSDNVEMPVLQPWRNTTKPPSERYVFERNPFFHRIDENGRQLPYLDRVAIVIVDKRLVAAKTAAGESDLQARNLALGDYTFLKEAEARNDYGVKLWKVGYGAELALYPNMNAKDPTWRAVMRDVRFRRGLSLAVHRRELNQVIYYGLGNPSANTLLPASPLYRESYAEAYTEFDPERAGQLLDEAGLDRRNEDGIRLLPDGRLVEIVIDTAGESSETTDILELVADRWRRVGIEAHTRPSQREVFRNRVFAGNAVMSVWTGLINGLATVENSPEELAPSSRYQYQWPDWGQYVDTQGEAGKPPSLPAAKRLVELLQAWRRATSAEAARQVWHEMLAIYADQVFSIGTVNSVPTPVVVHNALANLPNEGIYTWAPTSYFGVYRPDTFWFTDPARRKD